MNAAQTSSEPEQCLAIIESATPKAGSGQCLAGQIVGERVVVEAEIFGGEPDALSVVIKFDRPAAGTAIVGDA